MQLVDFSFQGVDDLIAAIGYGKLTVHQILGKIVPQEKLDQREGVPKEEGKGVLKEFLQKIHLIYSRFTGGQT
jgi:GTP pyrophosphokinase